VFPRFASSLLGAAIAWNTALGLFRGSGHQQVPVWRESGAVRSSHHVAFTWLCGVIVARADCGRRGSSGVGVSRDWTARHHWARSGSGGRKRVGWLVGAVTGEPG